MPWWAWVGLCGLGLDVLGASLLAFEGWIAARFFRGMEGFTGLSIGSEPLVGSSPAIERVHRIGWLLLVLGFTLQALALAVAPQA